MEIPSRETQQLLAQRDFKVTCNVTSVPKTTEGIVAWAKGLMDAGQTVSLDVSKADPVEVARLQEANGILSAEQRPQIEFIKSEDGVLQKISVEMATRLRPVFEAFLDEMFGKHPQLVVDEFVKYCTRTQDKTSTGSVVPVLSSHHFNNMGIQDPSEDRDPVVAYLESLAADEARERQFEDQIMPLIKRDVKAIQEGRAQAETGTNPVAGIQESTRDTLRRVINAEGSNFGRTIWYEGINPTKNGGYEPRKIALEVINRFREQA